MIKKTWLVVFCGLLGLSLIGCVSDQLEGPGLANRDPTVWLSAAPPEGSVSNYRVQLNWGGWDPDGEIDYYEWCVTDNESGVFVPEDTTGADKWRKVFRNDSTFTFSADELADSTDANSTILESVEFIRSHTFFIRAVDKLGLASRNPAYRSFTARTLSPVVDITIPTSRGATAAEVPKRSRFSWVGIDYISRLNEVQPPDSVRWILVPVNQHDNNYSAALEYIRRTPDSLMTKEKGRWYPWVYYEAPRDSGKSWTTPELDIPSSHMFAVQVKDEAGAISPVFDENRNVRRINVSPRSTGPVLTLYNKYIGTIITASPNTEPVIIDLPSNISMCFRITANAKPYGGIASGYRYGWDMQDLQRPEQWATDFTPFVREVDGLPVADIPCRAWQFDSHTIYIEVIDNSGYRSRVGVTVNVVPFSMRKNVFIVDDWMENPPGGWSATAGAVPSDAEHDEFWEYVLGDVNGFDPVADVLDVSLTQDEVPLTAFAEYKSLIWVATASHNSQTRSFINNVIRYVDPEAQASTGKTFPNTVALFMAAGGKVMLVGEQIMCASINRESFNPVAPVFPMIFRYELSGDQDGDYGSSDVGVRGVGQESFSYQECCLNVLDIAYIQNRQLIRRADKQACPINVIRPAPHSGLLDGLREAIPVDTNYVEYYNPDLPVFPKLTLRPECAGPGRWYRPDRSGLNADIYNPLYFAEVEKGMTLTGTCNDFAELVPARSCFEPIYLHGCKNTASKIYEAPVAFWTGTFKDRVPDAGGVAARSLVMGFHPVYFEPDSVRAAMNKVFKVWGLPSKLPSQ